MRYDFEKLRKPYLLTLLLFYLGTDNLQIIESDDSASLVIGDSLFVVSEGIVHYVGGAPKEVSRSTVELVRDKLQSAVSLECVVMESGGLE
jgi:hypothetical protein